MAASSGLGYSVNAGGTYPIDVALDGTAVCEQSAGCEPDIQLASSWQVVELGDFSPHSIRSVVVVEAIAPDVPGLQQPRGDPSTRSPADSSRLADRSSTVADTGAAMRS